MKQNAESLAVWWVPSKDDNRLQESEEAVAMLPEYIAEEAYDLMGRAKRGRLWVSKHLNPQVEQINWDDSKPCASRAAESGGIIIYKKDIDALAQMPGFVTDLQMNMIRELN